MSETVPLGAGDHFLGSSLAPPQTAAAAAGPLPILSNARIAGRCRVVDCQIDLNTQTNTNRKYYLCRDHWAAEAVMVEGIPQRFCGQCSRFKILSEYDGPKRTCRQCLLLRNTKKRNRRYEQMQKGAYLSAPSSLSPYRFSGDTCVQPGEGLPRLSLPTTAGLYYTRFDNNSSFQNNTSPRMALLQQQLLELQQGLSVPNEAPARCWPQPPIANMYGIINGPDMTGTIATATDIIDVNSLDTVLGLITAIGTLGDGHTGNAEADTLYYLFQELQTLKHDVETKGITLASMEAKRRKVVAEQELAKVNLEVADIEEQLTQVAVINRHNERQQQQGQGLGAAALAYQILKARITGPANEEGIMANNQSTYITPTLISTSVTTTGTATVPGRPQENLHLVGEDSKAGSGTAAPDDGDVHVKREGPDPVVLPLPINAGDQPNLKPRDSP